MAGRDGERATHRQAKCASRSNAPTERARLRSQHNGGEECEEKIDLRKREEEGEGEEMEPETTRNAAAKQARSFIETAHG